VDWGIPVPKAGYENKTIYIWAENVLGYLSAARRVADERGESFEELFSENAYHYYVHGKDNIPFHTIILPALLLANRSGYHLPDQIVSSEYLTLEGRKISTSQNYAIWVKDLLDKYDPDSLRYYFLANGPEKKDSDFSWTEYVNNHNGELLGAYGNFINRSLTFVIKYFDGIVPQGELSDEWKETLTSLYAETGSRIEKGNFKDAIEGVFDAVRRANKFFDENEPWKARTTDEAACRNTLYQCVQIIANLAVILAPFLPFSSDKVCKWLNISNDWSCKEVKTGYVLPKIQILFERLDKKVIEEERDKLSIS
jgi:methionyl-tRNA synthetase